MKDNYVVIEAIISEEKDAVQVKNINKVLKSKEDAVGLQKINERMEELKEQMMNLVRLNVRSRLDNQIYDEEIDEYFKFDIDKEDEGSFCEYFKKNDMDGRESFLKIFYEVDDSRIKNINSIGNEINKYIKLLLPLYNSMVYRLK